MRSPKQLKPPLRVNVADVTLLAAADSDDRRDRALGLVRVVLSTTWSSWLESSDDDLLLEPSDQEINKSPNPGWRSRPRRPHRVRLSRCQREVVEHDLRESSLDGFAHMVEGDHRDAHAGQ